MQDRLSAGNKFVSGLKMLGLTGAKTSKLLYWYNMVYIVPISSEIPIKYREAGGREYALRRTDLSAVWYGWVRKGVCAATVLGSDWLRAASYADYSHPAEAGPDWIRSRLGLTVFDLHESG